MSEDLVARALRLRALPSDLIALLQDLLADYTKVHQFDDYNGDSSPDIGPVSSRLIYLRLLQRLATNDSFQADAALCISISCCFGKANRQMVSTILSASKDFLSSIPGIVESLHKKLELLLKRTSIKEENLTEAVKLSHVFSSLAYTSTLFAEACGNTTALIMATCQLYSQFCLSAAAKLPCDESLPLTGVTKSLLALRMNVLFGVFESLKGGFFAPVLTDNNLPPFAELMRTLNEERSVAEAATEHPAFLNSSLPEDLVQITGLLNLLNNSVDANIVQHDVLQNLKATISGLDASEGESMMLVIFEKDRDTRSGVLLSSIAERALQEAVEQILSVLPEQDPSNLRQYLRLPEYHNEANTFDTQKLVDALLEGSVPLLPDDLAESVAGVLQPKYELLSQRRNVFDDQKLNPAAMSWGRSDKVSKQGALSEAMKRQIIAMAEADSDEDSDYEWEAAQARERAAKSQADGTREVDPDEWDELDIGQRVAPRGAIDEEDSSSDDDQGATAAKPENSSSDNLFSPQIVEILSKAYIEHGLDIFIRIKPQDQKKASPARNNLLAQLKRNGWPDGSDDLAESWAKQLDRDPKKQRRLAAFEFAGNQNMAPDTNHTFTPAANSSASRGGSRGRGQSRGRGSGKAAHDRRTRGHDRKMRGGMGAL